MPSWLPQAHAAGDGCPDGLKGAATDATWAADRIESIRDEKLTTMLAYDEDGAEHRYASAADEKLVVKTLQELGHPVDSAGRYPAASHAEAEVAYWMRTAGVTHVVAVINNPKSVCSGGTQTCDAIVRKLLPEGSVLEVWEPGNSKPVRLVGGS